MGQIASGRAYSLLPLVNSVHHDVLDEVDVGLDVLVSP
jgi:hypothetical protein